MNVVVLTGLIFLGLVGVAFLVHKLFENEALTSLVGLIAFLMGMIFFILIPCWFSAKETAKLINEEYGTSYTTDEVFFSKSVIMQALYVRTRENNN